jgi:folylpolyglutamate synthase/dihydropteroate synthase
MLPGLLERVDAAILTTPPSATDRRWDPEAVAAWCADNSGIVPRVIPDLAAALQRATTMAPHGSVIVTGSLFTVGDAMRELGVAAV